MFSKGIKSIYADFFKKKFKNVFFASAIQQSQKINKVKCSKKKTSKLRKTSSKKIKATKFHKLKQKPSSLKRKASLLSFDRY
jgi:hypothetical protein